MKRKQGQILTAVLVDYDNIYLALRRKNEEAARRFAKDASLWLREIESGSLITPTNSVFGKANRRIVLNRCYGNPVPRRNTHDNSTDMSSFPFVRHHFLRSGFEVVDCPPLTAQLKNSSDIRMVMDVRDFLLHDTYFDEFIILSGDADFTPVLHRLRAHARRTVIFANDHTAVPYKAISDGEIRESDLISLLAETMAVPAPAAEPAVSTAAATPLQLEDQRRAIVGEVLAAVRASRHPIPLDLLADRVTRILGADRTSETGWAGAGSLRELLALAAAAELRIGDRPPYMVYDTSRQLAEAPQRAQIASPQVEASEPELKTVPQSIAQPEETATFVIDEPLSSSIGAHEQVRAAEPLASREPQPFQANIAPPVQAPEPMAPPVAAPSSTLGAIGNLFRTSLPPLGATLASQDPAALRPEARVATPPPAAPPPQPTYPDFEANAAQQAHVMQQPTTMFGGLPINYSPSQVPPPVPPRQPQQDFARHVAAMAPPPAPPQLPPVAQAPQQPQAQRAPDATTATALQQSIARIHEACQAPPLSPPEYRVLFDVMAREITERGLAGSQTLTNIAQRALEQGVELRRDDIRFVLEVVSESDPWFEQGASATLFAGRFRNFVVARCRSQGLNLSADELDLIEAWFVAGAPAQQGYGTQRAASRPAAQPPEYRPADPQPRQPPSYGYGQAPAAPPQQPAMADEEFPRIVRTRLRG